MTDVNRGPGVGRGTPVETLVTADQTTITGDGTKTAPLVAVGGAIAVVVDDTSIGGDGTTAEPLHTISFGTEVAVDGSSIVGSGLADNPLAVVGGPSGAGVSDGVTLQGTGLLVNPYAIKAVQHDTTLSGNGTVAVPLTVLTDNADGVTLQGDGLAASPFAIKAVQHDTTLSGNGTVSSPLSVISGAGAPQMFAYTVTGSEPDLAHIVIAFGTGRADAAYLVVATMQAGTNFYGVPQIQSKTDAGFTLGLSANAVAGDVWAFYVADAFAA